VRYSFDRRDMQIAYNKRRRNSRRGFFGFIRPENGHGRDKSISKHDDNVIITYKVRNSTFLRFYAVINVGNSYSEGEKNDDSDVLD